MSLQDQYTLTENSRTLIEQSNCLATETKMSIVTEIIDLDTRMKKRIKRILGASGTHA